MRKPDIEALLETRPVAKTDHFVLHCLAQPLVVSELSTDGAPDRNGSVDILPVQDPPRPGRGLATLVPKRHARRAVTRNLIRRQMRDMLRHDVGAPAACKVLIRLRAPFDARLFPAAASSALRVVVRAELQALLAQRDTKLWR